MKNNYLVIFLFLSAFFSFNGFAQIDEIDYQNPVEYKIASVRVESDRPVNRTLVASLSGLVKGKTIKVPGQDLSSAIETLWDQNLFSNVEIVAEKVVENEIYILIKVQTRPRLSKYVIQGMKKSEKKTITDQLKLGRGDIISENYIKRIENKIIDYYIEKGYSVPTVDIVRTDDTLYNKNSNRLKILVGRGKRVKIDQINIEGNTAFSDFRLKMLLKNTKQTGFLYTLRSSKFKYAEYETDKTMLPSFYQSKGFRDAALVKDSVYKISEGKIGIDLRIEEGKIYYFRDIKFSGNTKYPSDFLSAILNLKKGDIYDPIKLEKNLRMNPNGLDISTLYMDNGYLFFNLVPVETSIVGDSIDMEIRIYEGPQATINRVLVSGNDRTNDHVFLRELQTRPGDKFSRSNVFLTQQRLSQLGLIDPETLDIKTNPDPKNGTVDIEYVVSERASDQIELSMGWGQGQLVGVLGLTLNNFSTRNLFSSKNWGGPYPMGDGQKLSIRAQSSGRVYQAYNFSFTEPWFGGKKPNSLTFSLNHMVFKSNLNSETPGKFISTGGSIGVGKRLKWPDRYFNMYNGISYKKYTVQNSNLVRAIENGSANNLFFTHSISRSSISAPIYPKGGSSLSLSVNWTPPVSKFRNIDLETATAEEKYKWIEYHKWRFDSDFYFGITDKLILKAAASFGYLGSYSSEYGSSPFERFFMGGDGLTGYNYDGRELIKLRGYQNNAISPLENGYDDDGNYGTLNEGGTVFNKFTFELRYPLSLNPQATVYLLSFLEAGNNFIDFKSYNPYDLYRSAGFGVRLFLPMFGLIGFDYGFGMDGTVGLERQKGGQFHISIGQQF